MARYLRPHYPGVPFHITARAQGREALFEGLQATVVQLITEHATYADIQLLAYAVMPNHLHLLLVQGARPLSSFMQPLLRRIALRVMRSKSRDGHIFERRYREVTCLDANHFRNSIAYVHLNGMRGGLCKGADDFEWCSHALLCSIPDQPADSPDRMRLDIALRVFANEPGDTLAVCRDQYFKFVAWRIAMDRWALGGGAPSDRDAPQIPWCTGGDAHWEREYSSAVLQLTEGKRRAAPKADLRDLALRAIADLAPAMELEQLRSGDRGRHVVRVRRYVIARALTAGHKPVAISRFFSISRGTVSRIAHSR